MQTDAVGGRVPVYAPAMEPRPVLPTLRWAPTAASDPRHGHPVTRVVVHRWGVRYTNPKQEAASYHGVVAWFMDTSHKASAHVVFPGSAVKGHATQMVAWSHAAWAEAAYNAGSDEVEAADAVWLGHDQAGLEVLARIVACRVHARGLPPVWSHERGFCRHADLGQAGGGHPECPTVDLALWRDFAHLVEREYHRGGCRDPWGR